SSAGSALSLLVERLALQEKRPREAPRPRAARGRPARLRERDRRRGRAHFRWWEFRALGQGGPDRRAPALRGGDRGRRPRGRDPLPCPPPPRGGGRRRPARARPRDTALRGAERLR